MGNEYHRDTEWFEGIFRAHSQALRAYFRRRMDGDPDDAVSDVFVIAWRRRDSVPDPALPWLYSTAANVMKEHQRRHAVQQRVTHRLGREPVAATDRVARVTDELGAEQRVAQLFDALSSVDAEVLRLWAWEELSGRDLAAALGVSPTAARARLARARQRAAKLLGLPDEAIGSPAGHNTLETPRTG